MVTQKQKGEHFYVQFTEHVFNYRGKRAKFFVAHDITDQIDKEELETTAFPKIQPTNGIAMSARVIWDSNLNVLDWSEEAEELFGWKEEEVAGKEDFFEHFVYEEELEEAYERYEKAFNDSLIFYNITGRNVDKFGNVRLCRWDNSIIYDEDGKVIAVHTSVQDITEQKRAEVLYKILTEQSLVGTYLIQGDLFRYVNPKLCEIFGLSKKEIENKLSPIDLAAPEDKALVKESIRKLIENGADSIEYGFKGKTQKGETVHIETYGTVINYLGRPAIIGSLLDVTHTKLAVERYKTSVESFENLFDSISDAVHILNENGRFLKLNEAALKLYGYDRSELIGQTLAMLAAPGKNDLEKVEEYYQKAQKGETQEFNFWAERKGGEIFPLNVSVAPANYMDKNVMIVITRDTSERYEIEQQVKQSQKKFSKLFKNAPLGIVMLDRGRDIQFTNPAFENLFGYSNEEVKGLDVDKLIVPESGYKEAAEISKNTYEGKISVVRAKRKRKDGSLIDVLVYSVPVKLKEDILAAFGIYADISDRIKYQEKIETSLNEKKVMLAEIHHRVKNNLAVITGLLELQQYKTKLEPAKNILRESQLRINSIALIHEKLYQNEDLSAVSIDAYLEELSGIIAQSMKSEMGDIAVNIKADATNLTINQAIPCGLILNELITNSFKHAFKDDEDGEISVTLNSSDNIFNLEFKDNGSGLPDSLDFENPSSLGITLIKTLSQQLDARNNFENKDEGMHFSLQFEIEK